MEGSLETPSKRSVYYSTLSNESTSAEGTPKPEISTHSQASTTDGITLNGTIPRGATGDSASPQSPCTSINIQQVVVYNFGSSSQSANGSRRQSTRQGKPHNLSSSSGPICRICHEGDGQEELVSPCNCAGTLGLVHLSCMEHWLSTSNTDGCEICKCKFVLKRSPRSFVDWLRSSSSEGIHRNIIGDLVCFVLLTPLAAMSSFMCINGAMQQAAWKNIWEASSLIALAAFLVTVYFGWTFLAVRYHYRRWRSWRTKNQQVRVLSVVRRRASLSHGADNVASTSALPRNEYSSSPEAAIHSPRSPSSDSTVFIENVMDDESSPLHPRVILSLRTIESQIQSGVINPLFNLPDFVNMQRTGPNSQPPPGSLQDTSV